MAFTQQNDDGTVDNANAYTDPATVRAYWADRGVDLSASTDAQLQAAIVKATTYLDARYKFVGYQMRRLQGTQWPRGGLTTTPWPNDSGYSFLRGLPPALIAATCMLTTRALTKDLMPDPTYDASGQKVTEETKKVGPIEVSKKYAESYGAGLASSTPQYPEVTLTLQNANMIASGNSGQVVRG